MKNEHIHTHKRTAAKTSTSSMSNKQTERKLNGIPLSVRNSKAVLETVKAVQKWPRSLTSYK